MHRSLVALLGAFALSGCVTTGAIDGAYHLDRTAGAQCAAHCRDLGMALGAVVIIRNSTGCVCEPGESFSRTGGGGAVAGATAIQLIEEQQAQALQAPPPAAPR